MDGDTKDFVSRLRRVLPRSWFGDLSPLTDAALTGISVAWSAIYSLIMAVADQTRLSTATGPFIDMISVDFFGQAFPRRGGEPDKSFQTRVRLELLRPRCTRDSMIAALTDLTGQTPQVFEPALPNDTGGYSVGGLGYGVAGGWGNLSLRFQTFVTAYRPKGAGIAYVAGYDTGGCVAYGGSALENVTVTDQDIYAAVAAILPTGYVAWTQILG